MPALWLAVVRSYRVVGRAASDAYSDVRVCWRSVHRHDPNSHMTKWLHAGNCIICGAPIYVDDDSLNPGPAETKPEVYFSCECRNRNQWNVWASTLSTATTITIPQIPPNWPIYSPATWTGTNSSWANTATTVGGANFGGTTPTVNWPPSTVTGSAIFNFPLTCPTCKTQMSNYGNNQYHCPACGYDTSSTAASTATTGPIEMGG